jgi:hypothetical protein
VNWLARAKRVRARLADIVREIYLEHRVEIEELRRKGQRLWEREDLVWHLAIHRIVSSQAGVTLDPALSYEGVRECILSTDDPVRSIERVLSALSGGVMHTRERANALVRAYEQVASEGGLEVVNQVFRSLPDRRAMSSFLRRFELGPDGRYSGIQSVYDPFRDLFRPEFEVELVVTEEMQTLLDRLRLFLIYVPPSLDTPGAAGDADASETEGKDTRQSMNEQFYRGVAEQAKLQPWELEQLIRRYFFEVLRAVNGLGDELDKEASSKATAGGAPTTPC